MNGLEILEKYYSAFINLENPRDFLLVRPIIINLQIQFQSLIALLQIL